jgi:hypothetical protein
LKHKYIPNIEWDILILKKTFSLVVISVFRQLRQENWEFEASLAHIVRPCLQKNKMKFKKLAQDCLWQTLQCIFCGFCFVLWSQEC